METMMSSLMPRMPLGKPLGKLWSMILVSIALGGFAAPGAIAQDPFCYRATPEGQIVDLTSLCNAGRITGAASITATNLKLEVAEEEFLSSRVKATVINRSDEPVEVAVVQLRITRSNKPLTTISIPLNRVLEPKQSVPVSEIFDKADLQGQDPEGLSVSFQGWQ
ncbi:MAG: hypothetical protein ACRC8A_13005 [Microcoleaceae cyanobacterium]